MPRAERNAKAAKRRAEGWVNPYEGTAQRKAQLNAAAARWRKRRAAQGPVPWPDEEEQQGLRRKVVAPALLRLAAWLTTALGVYVCMTGKAKNLQQPIGSKQKVWKEGSQIVTAHDEFFSCLLKGTQRRPKLRVSKEELMMEEASGGIKRVVVVGPPGSGAAVEARLTKTEARFVERELQLWVTEHHPELDMHTDDKIQQFKAPPAQQQWV
jgi:hypothetical protein